MTDHLAILKKEYIEAILTGKKSFEARFNKTRKAPFGQVRPGNKIYLKISSGPIIASATAEDIIAYESLCRYQIARIKQEYNDLICGSDEFWNSVENCRYGLLIKLRDIRSIGPVNIDKTDWRTWVVLSKENDFGLLDL